MSMEKKNPPPPAPPKKEYARAKVTVQYLSACCGAPVGDPDEYELNDGNEHQQLVGGQEGTCPKCNKDVTSPDYAFGAPEFVK